MVTERWPPKRGVEQVSHRIREPAIFVGSGHALLIYSSEGENLWLRSALVCTIKCASFLCTCLCVCVRSLWPKLLEFQHKTNLGLEAVPRSGEVSLGINVASVNSSKPQCPGLQLAVCFADYFAVVSSKALLVRWASGNMKIFATDQ